MLFRALEIYKKYDDQLISFTDCTSFAIMESLRIEEALAFDNHFSCIFRSKPNGNSDANRTVIPDKTEQPFR